MKRQEDFFVLSVVYSSPIFILEKLAIVASSPKVATSSFIVTLLSLTKDCSNKQLSLKNQVKRPSTILSQATSGFPSFLVSSKNTPRSR